MPFSASIAHLKVNGTARVATLAIKSSTTDQATRILRSARSPGQMNGHRCTSVPIRVALSAGLAGAGASWPAGANRYGPSVRRPLWEGAPARNQVIFKGLHMPVI